MGKLKESTEDGLTIPTDYCESYKMLRERKREVGEIRNKTGGGWEEGGQGEGEKRKGREPGGAKLKKLKEKWGGRKTEKQAQGRVCK